MKIKRIALLLTLFTSIACTNQSSRIKGKITDSKGKMLYFEHVDASATRSVDSSKLGNSGKFSFKTRVRIPDFYQLRLGKNQIISLLVKPSESITIKADGHDIEKTLEIKGSFESENLNKLVRYLNETRAKLDSINNLYDASEEDSLMEKFSREYASVLESHRKYSMAYLLTHTNSMTCIYALYQQVSPGQYVFYKNTDLQFFKIVSDTLGKYYPRSKHVAAFRKNVRRMLNDYQTKRLLSMADTVKTTLPGIELADMDGKIRKLNSLKGKYVLLSFWASWNEDCIAQNLRLKEVYYKYHRNNFEIMQVSFDNQPEAWKRAVRFDELPWISVIDSSFPNSLVAANYNIQELPANYLIDKDNTTILAKNLSPEQLQTELSELLNQ
ncbi:MAG: AhpC/TSA family protein [Bacteroidales bacterium]|nr:AhpC/TSA family protein [Bacteroidales bacterium]MBN2761543.1 AhpC/TSA family protein [Bacteroidales bacterium]